MRNYWSTLRIGKTVTLYTLSLHDRIPNTNIKHLLRYIAYVLLHIYNLLGNKFGYLRITLAHAF